jgi:hypothetical protein
MVSTNGQIPASIPYVQQPWAFSTDGGVTWPASLQSESIPPPIVNCFGDPVAFFDRSGRAYYCTLGVTGTSTGSGIYFVSTTDFGATWSARSQADPNASTNDDKEHAAADYSGTYPNNVYVAWSDFNVSGTPVVFNRSTNQGQTWGTRQTLAIGSNRGQGVHIAIGPNGEVYVIWAHYTTASTQEVGIGFAKSTDGGATFSTPTIAYPMTGIRTSNGAITALNGTRASSFPYADVDRSNGSRRGWIYVVAPELVSGQSDIFLHRSTDGGTTWSSAIQVNGPDVEAGKWQFMASIAVDPATGGISVSYYSMDSVGTNFMANRYMAYSVDGGNTWDKFVISDVRANWAPQGTPNTNATYNGDYYETAAMNGKAWACWSDRRLGAAGSNNRAFIQIVTYGINFGWLRGTVTNTSGGAPVQNAAIDFVQNVLQQGGSTNAAGSYFAGALVDTPATTANLTLRARRFGFRDTLLNVTLTRSDTLTRNFAMTPLPSGTLTVHSFITGGAGIRANVRVLFGGSEVANAFTDSVSGLYTTSLPTGSYSVIVDPPSPYATRTFNNVTITANTTTTVDALVRAVVEFSPAAIRDTLVVGAVHTKSLQLTNTTTDSVAFRLSDDVGLDHFRKREPAVQPREFPMLAVEKAKGAPDTEFGDSPTGGGGPDAFGYRWIDSDSSGGPVFNWVDISSVGTPITTWIGTGDDGYVTVPIGLPIPFYGNSYTNLNICTNGFISFTSTSTAFTNTGIPATAEPNNTIYGFWDDLDVRTSGTIYYYRDSVNSRFIVQYNNVPHLTSGGPYSFEIILKPNGEILSQYFNMVSLLNSATIGIENAAGTVGLQVAFNANYVHNNLAVKFFLPDAPWISENPSFGVLPPGSNRNITVTFDASGLSAGTLYPGKIFLDATHPDVSGSIIIPASLLVQQATQALLILNKTNIAYGATPLNTTRRDSISARNGGAQPLSITSITTNNPRYVASPASATVQPGDSTRIYVSYTPNAPATDTGRVIILSNSQGSPRRDVILSGSGFGAPRMTVTPDSFSFSRQAGTDTTRANLKIKNPGTDTLRYTINESLQAPGGPVIMSKQRGPVVNIPVDLPKGAMDSRRGTDQTDGAGGPDAFGYRWIDSDEPGGPPFGWLDISGSAPFLDSASAWTPTGTSFRLGDEGYYPVRLPFTFGYYGVGKDSIFIGTDGNVMFQRPTGDIFTNAVFPTPGGLIDNHIGVWWDDLEVRAGAKVYYGSSGGNYVVQYQGIALFSGTVPNYTFEVILSPSGQIKMQYLNMGINGGILTSSSIGIENSTGSIGLQTVFNAAYMHNNLAIIYTSDLLPWISTNRTSGTIAPGDSQNVEIRIHPAGLAGGNYSGVLRVRGNTSDTANIRVRLQVLTDVRAEAGLIPTEFALNQNYPNPFNPSTKISFALPSESAISLRIYSILGQEVLVLANEKQPAGYYSVEWDGRNRFGNKVASGVYFYRLEAKPVSGGKAFSNLRKMVLLK